VLSSPRSFLTVVITGSKSLPGKSNPAGKQRKPTASTSVSKGTTRRAEKLTRPLPYECRLLEMLSGTLAVV
jgi:hypothetical protein